MRRGLRATAVLGCPRLSVSPSSLTAPIIVGLGLMVAVKILEEDAFVITAFFTAEVKGGEQIWPKE